MYMSDKGSVPISVVKARFESSYKKLIFLYPLSDIRRLRYVQLIVITGETK